MNAAPSRRSPSPSRFSYGFLVLLLVGGLVLGDSVNAFAPAFGLAAQPRVSAALDPPSSAEWLAADPITVVAQVSSDTDDVFDWGTDSVGYIPTSNLVRLGRGGSLVARVGFRFDHLNVPQGATILSAELQVKSAAEYHNFMRLRIYGHDVDDSPPFTAASRPSVRLNQITAAGVDWNPPSTWLNQTWYASPDVKRIVQAIINRTGWASDNALTLLVIDNGSSPSEGRNVVAYDLDPGSAAKLVISYIPGATLTPTQTRTPTVTFTPTQITTPTATFKPIQNTTPASTCPP